MESARVSWNPTEFNEINCNCYGIHANFIESVGLTCIHIESCRIYMIFLWNPYDFNRINMILTESIGF